MVSAGKGLEERKQEKDALVSRISHAVKQLLVATAGTNTVTTFLPQLENLMRESELILRHGLKNKLNLFEMKSSASFWPLVVAFTSKGNLEMLERNHDTIQAKEQAWISLAITDNSFANYLLTFRNERAKLSKFYDETALLLDNERTEIIEKLFISLEGIRFQLSSPQPPPAKLNPPAPLPSSSSLPPKSNPTQPEQQHPAPSSSSSSSSAPPALPPLFFATSFLPSSDPPSPAIGASPARSEAANLLNKLKNSPLAKDPSKGAGGVTSSEEYSKPVHRQDLISPIDADEQGEKKTKARKKSARQVINLEGEEGHLSPLVDQKGEESGLHQEEPEMLTQQAESPEPKKEKDEDAWVFELSKKDLAFSSSSSLVEQAPQVQSTLVEGERDAESSSKDPSEKSSSTDSYGAVFKRHVMGNSNFSSSTPLDASWDSSMGSEPPLSQVEADGGATSSFAEAHSGEPNLHSSQTSEDEFSMIRSQPAEGEKGPAHEFQSESPQERKRSSFTDKDPSQAEGGEKGKSRSGSLIYNSASHLISNVFSAASNLALKPVSSITGSSSPSSSSAPSSRPSSAYLSATSTILPPPSSSSSSSAARPASGSHSSTSSSISGLSTATGTAMSSSHTYDDYQLIEDDDDDFGVEKVDGKLELLLPQEIGLSKQEFRCFDCGSMIGASIFGEARLCNYNGKYYCVNCHQNDLSPIPSRMIANWDFAKYRVSKKAKILIKASLKKPLIPLLQLNPFLESLFDEIRDIAKLRYELSILREYIHHCSVLIRDQDAKTKLLQKIWLREHLATMSEKSLYSMQDLVDIQKGKLLPFLVSVREVFTDHVLNCKLCKFQGSYCDFCQSKSIIYAFDSDKVSRCPRCSALAHKSCFVLDNCPTCKRKGAKKA